MLPAGGWSMHELAVEAVAFPIPQKKGDDSDTISSENQPHEPL